MVHNLLRNALDPHARGTPVEVEVAVDGDRAVLRVRDHGPGMSAEEARHAFDRFYRGDAGQRSGGSGLGLFIVERLARSFGRIGVGRDPPRAGCDLRGRAAPLAGATRPRSSADADAARRGSPGGEGSQTVGAGDRGDEKGDGRGTRLPADDTVP